MIKKKILKKQKLTWKDIQETEIDEKKLKELEDVNPEEIFKDSSKIGAALLECLHDNDVDSFIEILEEYLKVNKAQLAKKAKIGRSTLQEIFSKKGNPTLKTIAKIVHHGINAEQDNNVRRGN